MKHRIVVFINFFAILLVNGVVVSVLSYNRRNGVYPPDADSTLIPLMEAYFISILLIILLFLAAISKAKLRWLARVSLSLASIFCFIVGVGWTTANHIPIAVSYFVLSVSLAYMTATLFSKKDFYVPKS